MTQESGNSPRSRGARRPLAAGLIAVAAVALVATLAAAGAFPGPARNAAEASPVPVVPNGAPAAGQDGSAVDVGWVAPTSRGGAKAPAFGGGAGRGAGMGAITITKIDGAKLALETTDGWTRTIDTTGATITRAGTKIGVGDLAVGDEIVLRQKRQADGTFTVTAIRVILPKVAGTVTAVTSTSLTLAARDGTKTTVKLTSSTTYRLGKAKADLSTVKVGMQAVAAGPKAADGTLTATSIVVQASRVAGTVTATSGSTITLASKDDSKVTVKVTSSTTYRVAGVEKATLTDVKVDMWIVAVGVRDDDASFAATAVNAAKAGPHRGWGDWKPGRGQPGGSDDASPAPAGSQQPSSEG